MQKSFLDWKKNTYTEMELEKIKSCFMSGSAVLTQQQARDLIRERSSRGAEDYHVLFSVESGGRGGAQTEVGGKSSIPCKGVQRREGLSGQQGEEAGAGSIATEAERGCDGCKPEELVH
eukprot:766527-Hanusia_phi.AAC.3